MSKAKGGALSRLAKDADKMLRGELIEQYAAICVRRVPEADGTVQVLLITSRDTGRWVIPKGWGMARKAPHEVARQEAWEEAGVRGKVRKKPYGYYTYVKSLSSGEAVPSVVQVHMLDVSKIEPDFPERGQRKLQWFSPLEAAGAVREPELKSLLAKIENEACRR